MWCHQIFIFAFQYFHNNISELHDKNPHTSNMTHYEPDQFTLISVGLTRFSCSHISDHNEPIPTKFWFGMFFIMLHQQMNSKCLNAKKDFCNIITSVLNRLPHLFFFLQNTESRNGPWLIFELRDAWNNFWWWLTRFFYLGIIL